MVVGLRIPPIPLFVDALPRVLMLDADTDLRSLELTGFEFAEFVLDVEVPSKLVL